MANPRPAQPAICVGELIHKDVDFQKLLDTIEGDDASPEALIKLSAEHAPGSATLGFIEASNRGLDLAERCGAALEDIFTSEKYKDVPSVDMGFNHTPAMVFTDTFNQLLLSSKVLTVTDVSAVRLAVRAKGGCSISVLYQAYRKKDGRAAGSHVEVIATPDNAEDGPPIALSLVLTLPDTDKWKIAKAIIQELTGCDKLDPPAPEGDLPKAFCGPPGTGALAPDNALLVLPRDKWAATLAEYLARNKLTAMNTEPDCAVGVLNHPTEAITTYKGDIYAMSVFKQLEELSRISIEGGYLLSFGSHLGMHSCVTNAVRVLSCALPAKFKSDERRFVPARELIDMLVDNADGFYLANKRDARINEYDDEGVFEKATRERIRDHISKIWADENMNRQPTPNTQSWANIYDNFQTSHSDQNARTFYVQIAWAVTHHLENMAADLRPPGEAIENTEMHDLIAPLTITPSEDPTQSSQKGSEADWLASLSDSDKQELSNLFKRAEEALDEKPPVGDEEMFKAATDIFELLRTLDDAVTTRITEAYGAEAASTLATQAQPAPDQPAGDFVVARLATLAEIAQPGSTRDLEAVAEPSLTGSPAERAAAYRAMGIALRHYPEQAEKIKALCWLLFSDPLRIGLGLMVFWQSIRYAHSNDGGRTSELGPEIAGVVLFTVFMPALDAAVDHLAMASGGHLKRVQPLRYPLRLSQQIPQAAIGGHLIGYTMGLISGVSPDANVPTRLASELARLVAGLWGAAALNYFTDVYLFHQEFDHLEVEGSPRAIASKALKRMRQDLVTVEHWLRVRIPLAIALGLHRETTKFWYSVYDKSDSAIVRNLVGGSQFATFYVSVVIFMMFGGLRYDIEDPRLLSLAPQFFKNKAPRTEPSQGQD